MSFFSNEEFDIMFHEVMDSEQVCYDMLLHISQKSLSAMVRKWCYNNPVLCGRQYEEDIMQEIQIRLIKNCVTGFFLRNGKPNYDPQGFKNWMFTLALNVKNDFAKKTARHQLIESEELTETAGIYHEEHFCSDEEMERLANAFRIVMDSDSKVYKVLTWIAQMIIIANANVTKIESNEVLIRCFDSMTLDAMFRLIIQQSVAIPWLTIDEVRAQRIKGRLDEIQPDGRRMGDMLYRDFYMKKGAKATISDWVNRMNNYIAKEERKL